MDQRYEGITEITALPNDLPAPVFDEGWAIRWLLEGMVGYQKSLAEIAELLTEEQYAQLSDQAVYDARMLSDAEMANLSELLVITSEGNGVQETQAE